MREFIRFGTMTAVLAGQFLIGVVTAVHADEYSRDEYSRDEYSRDSRDVDSAPATGSSWGSTMLQSYQDAMNQSNARDAEAHAALEDAVRRGTEEREAREEHERMQRAAEEENDASAPSAGASLTIDDSYAREQAQFRAEHEARMEAGARRDAEAKARAEAASAAANAQMEREMAERAAASKPCERAGCASSQ